MIDLHSHILPGLDDGAVDLEAAMAMARLAVEDGITVMACTPHVKPGVYENGAASIDRVRRRLVGALERAAIPLALVGGADVHVAPDLPEALRSGRIPTLNGSRYFLLEPPHHVVPPRFAELVANLLDIGYVPIITHPERLTWIKTRYELIADVNDMGCRLQVTADSLTGGFGRDASTLAWRLVDENRVDIVASDGHSPTARPPRLSAARTALAQHVGSAKADEMVLHRPAAVLADQELPPVAAVSRRPARRKPWMETLRQFAGMRSE